MTVNVCISLIHCKGAGKLTQHAHWTHIFFCDDSLHVPC